MCDVKTILLLMASNFVARKNAIPFGAGETFVLRSFPVGIQFSNSAFAAAIAEPSAGAVGVCGPRYFFSMRICSGVTAVRDEGVYMARAALRPIQSG